MINYRSYTDADFGTVLKLLGDNLEFDFMSSDLLREKLYDDPAWNPDNCVLAFHGESLVGFMQLVTREIRGEKLAYIKLAAVEKKSRRQGIGSAMLEQLTRKSRELSCSKLKIYDSPLNYYMPGVDPRYTPAVCFAEKHGFLKVGEAVNMEVDLDFSTWDVKEAESELGKMGISIRRATAKDAENINFFLEKEWTLWKREVGTALRNSPPSIFIAEKNGKVHGFAAYDGNNVGTGWFGPMGTGEEMRGLGIGRILLYLCLKDMKLKNLKKAVIPWVAPVSFYAVHAGARISRLFWRYEKIIE